MKLLSKNIVYLVIFSFFMQILPPIPAWADDVKAKAIVLPLELYNLTPGRGDILDNDFAELIKTKSGTEVVSGKALNHILNAQKINLDAYGKDDESLIKLARALQVENVYYGAISRLGDSYSLSIKKVNSSSGLVEKISDTFSCADEETLPQALRYLTNSFLGAEAGENPCPRRLATVGEKSKKAWYQSWWVWVLAGAAAGGVAAYLASQQDENGGGGGGTAGTSTTGDLQVNW